MQEIKKINLSLENVSIVPLKDVVKRVKVGFVGSCNNDYCSSDEGVPMIRTTNLTTEGIKLENLKYINNTFHIAHKKSQLHFGDILIARHGHNGLASLWEYKFDAQCLNVVVVEPDESLANRYYLTYLINSPLIQKQIKSLTGGSVQSVVNTKDIADLLIPIPSLDKQKEIADFISLFNKKISVCKSINKNLEEQLETLYNSFFVYYDDFLKEDLEECEIGLIPKEWSLLSLGDVTTKINEKVGSNDYKVFSAVNTGNLILSEEYFDKQVYSKSIEKYIVVKQKEFAYNPARINIGSIGRNDFGFDGCVSPVYVAFKVEEGYENFMNMYIKSNRFNQWVITLSSGSVRQTLNYNDFSIIKIAYPPKELINKFNTIYDSYYEVINYNKSVINNLEKIRDLLLPKLMSGEIDVSQINCDLELKYNYMKYLFNQIHKQLSKSVV